MKGDSLKVTIICLHQSIYNFLKFVEDQVITFISQVYSLESHSSIHMCKISGPHVYIYCGPYLSVLRVTLTKS